MLEFKPYAMDQRQLLPPHMKIPYLLNTWRSCQFSHRQSGSEQAVQQASRNRLSAAPPAYDAESPALCPVLKRPIHLGRLPQTFAGTSLSWGFAGDRKPGFRTVSRFRAEMKEIVEEVFYAVISLLIKSGRIKRENPFPAGAKIEANANQYT